MTNKRRSFFVLALLGCGCAASLPPSVKDRPAFTQFNPSGTWAVPGPALRWKAQTIPVAMSLEHGRQTFDVAVGATDLREAIVKGHALVDGDSVYTLTSDDLPATVLFVYEVGAEQMDGLRATKVLGYQHAVRKDKAPGDPVAGTWNISGIRSDGGNYKAELAVTKIGDHYSLTSTDGSSTFEGVAFLVGSKLVGCTVTTLSVKTHTTMVTPALGAAAEIRKSTTSQAHTAHFVLGAYRAEGNVLRGQSLYGSNEEGEKDRDQEHLVSAEWSRGATATAEAHP